MKVLCCTPFPTDEEGAEIVRMLPGTVGGRAPQPTESQHLLVGSKVSSAWPPPDPRARWRTPITGRWCQEPVMVLVLEMGVRMGQKLPEAAMPRPTRWNESQALESKAEQREEVILLLYLIALLHPSFFSSLLRLLPLTLFAALSVNLRYLTWPIRSSPVPTSPAHAIVTASVDLTNLSTLASTFVAPYTFRQ
ncbi:hypothetical protein Cob_v002835 [Colletotrichum orbiculare MAFF 240422]|uniref:Uncharacterized protein n=1 Tax=Colletotrichum orbiculare (strain 104-T / ATCC 96160 / CBS 514.97 / LARS 414 / MAFF 240422) TaxID=1213857 RepID=A0A484G0H3_COLOR|nr:hypothetical protein Cob_v002835 [Colletotrichum orbiculare MAFF 240422]